MLSDVYGHVVTDPAGDRWRAFWLGAYDSARRPKAPECLPGVAPVRPGEAGYGRKRHRRAKALLQESKQTALLASVARWSSSSSWTTISAARPT
jgi:hypothetical protein